MRALRPTTGALVTGIPEVLFVCVHNAGQGVEAVRPIRDEIDRRVLALLEELLGERAS